MPLPVIPVTAWLEPRSDCSSGSNRSSSFRTSDHDSAPSARHTLDKVLGVKPLLYERVDLVLLPHSARKVQQRLIEH